MPVVLSSLKVDVALETSGEWIDAPELPGVAFHVRSLNYPPYTAARDIELRKLAAIHGNQPIPRDARAAVFGRLYAEHILLDWRGFDVQWSQEAAVAALTDPEHRPLVQMVENAAAQVGTPKVQFTGDQEKN
ncbi:hypothetical protein J2X65_003147 [Ancylobacter sp. 3268]|uniref:hypothetical protein n=1 Tax=Ancylobacter sp. 3268 TaxID=2817752 RepID=UPI0028633F7C|nr:hypothetical protein [Ancylobacter sp. 3268]MDR6953784.1 hypothetical protein [Ancylobacter sp. 3268]